MPDMKHLILTMLIGFAVAQASNADVATGCIEVNTITRSGGLEVQQLTNNCQNDVRVHWCHTIGMEPEDTCGVGNNYFEWSFKLKPGQEMDNQFSLAAEAAIEYKACWGASRSTDNKDGTLTCSAPSISGLATEASVECGDTLTNFSVESFRPGIFVIKSSSRSPYTFNTIKGGVPQELNMKRAVSAVCGRDFAGDSLGTPLIDLMRSKLRKIMKDHAGKVESKCTKEFSRKACEGYYRAHMGITG